MLAYTPSWHLLGIGLLGDQQFTVAPGAIFRYAQWLSCKKTDDDLAIKTPFDSTFAKFKGSVLALLPAL